MLFIVRGKNRNHEHSMRIHAQTAEEAEAIGFKRGLFVTEVTPVETASSQSGKFERVADIVRRTWQRTPVNPLKAFGRVLSQGQALSLLMLGIATWAIDLRALVLH
jgi:hypothetical protein